MKPEKKPVIFFLSGQWKNIDENIRRGERPGGVPSVAGIWETCLKKGFECHVFMMTYTEDGWPRKTEELGGVTFHWMDFPFRRLTRWLQNHNLMGLVKPLWLIWQFQFLIRVLLTKAKPDVVYCMRTSFVIVGLILKLFYRSKLIVRIYGTFLYQYWFEEKNWLRRISNLGGLLAHKLPLDLLIMTNDGTRGDKIAEWVNFPMDKYRFWINGVNKDMKMESFDRDSFLKDKNIDPKSLVLMTLGRLTFWKRIDRVIDAMPEILKTIPEAKLVIVGDGELKTDLERHASEVGVSDSVIFVGAVPHHQIKEYLNACDIFVINNDLTNMCNTLIESLTSGCCVVTRDVGSTTEIATDGKNAYVLKPEEADNLADAVIELGLNSPERERLSNAAYEDAMQRFQTWDERLLMEVDEIKTLMSS
ncbi:MAG: glycosyltransferase family 1 protein [Gammaproteobacteria bacterium]|nr:MAG: glycosyltransferase family 1 protein [Gammaproteobacteria bacterium]